MSFLRLAAVSAALMLAGAALPSFAGAADYCVYPNQGCSQHNVTDLETALDQAAAADDADRIFLGADRYVAPAAKGGFSYHSLNAPVEIVGSGRGKTILTSEEGAFDKVLQLSGGPGTSIHDLTIHIPKNVSLKFRGLATINTARRIEVTEDDTQQAARYGVWILAGGALEDSSVKLDEGQDDTTGALLADPLLSTPPAIRNSVVRASTGVRIQGSAAIERSRVTGTTRPVVVAGGDVDLRDSLFVLWANIGSVLRAETATNEDTHVTADGVTVFAPPNQPDTGGISISTSPDPSRSVQLSLSNSIVRGYTPLLATAGVGGTATISAVYSDYNSDQSGALGPGAKIYASRVSYVGDAGFNEAPGHEYSLFPDSPLIDAGDPAPAPGFDVNGNARVADGDGDGIARRDIGAFELQPAQAGSPSAGGPSGGPAADTQAPLISGFRSTRSAFAVARAATPTAARTKRGTTLRYTLSENARVVVRIKRKAGRRYRAIGTLRRSGVSGPNRIGFTGRIGRRALRPGRYRAVITASDAAGNRSAPRGARFQVVR